MLFCPELRRKSERTVSGVVIYVLSAGALTWHWNERQMDQSSPKVLTNRRVLAWLLRAAVVRTVWIAVAVVVISALNGGGPWQWLFASGILVFVMTTSAAMVGAVFEARRVLRSNHHAAAYYASTDDKRKVAFIRSNVIW